MNREKGLYYFRSFRKPKLFLLLKNHCNRIHYQANVEKKKKKEEKSSKHEDMHFKDDKCSQENSGFLIKKGSDLMGMANNVTDKEATKLKKRPARLVLPQYYPEQKFGEVRDRKLENKEFEVQGRDFFLASKKRRREVMEDGYGAMVDILGDAKQAFFAVIDGHGGRAATDFVAENLGKNIVKALENVGKEDDDDQLEQAIRGGYLVTDGEFLSQHFKMLKREANRRPSSLTQFTIAAEVPASPGSATKP